MNIYEKQRFTPMLLDEKSEPFNDPEYIFELKFDGIRALIFAEPNQITIRNKRSEIINERYPELLSIAKTIKQKVIFDGEIVLFTEGKPNFSKLKERALLKNKMKIDYFVKNYPVVFIVYDILYENKDLTSLELIERKKFLNKYPNQGNFIKTEYFEEKGVPLYNEVVKHDLEGVVAKKMNSKYYVNKRSKEWIKIKNLLEEDFYICGYKEETNNAMASLLLGKKEDNNFIYKGSVTIGKRNPEFTLIKKTPIIKNPVLKKEGYKYISPTLECTVRFMEKTKNGQLRQPIYKGLKLD